MKQIYKILDPDLKGKVKNDFGESVGTYTLHLLGDGEYRTINRAFGIDLKGIMYIGETGKPLFIRVNSLARSIISNSDHKQLEPKERGHRTLSKKFYRIRKKVNINDLVIEVRDINKSPEEDESYLLESYVAKFGELPPLNGDYGKYADWGLF